MTYIRITYKYPLMPTILIMTELHLWTLNNMDTQAEELLHKNQIKEMVGFSRCLWIDWKCWWNYICVIWKICWFINCHEQCVNVLQEITGLKPTLVAKSNLSWDAIRKFGSNTLLWQMDLLTNICSVGFITHNYRLLMITDISEMYVLHLGSAK